MVDLTERRPEIAVLNAEAMKVGMLPNMGDFLFDVLGVCVKCIWQIIRAESDDLEPCTCRGTQLVRFEDGKTMVSMGHMALMDRRKRIRDGTSKGFHERACAACHKPAAEGKRCDWVQASGARSRYQSLQMRAL